MGIIWDRPRGFLAHWIMCATLWVTWRRSLVRTREIGQQPAPPRTWVWTKASACTSTRVQNRQPRTRLGRYRIILQQPTEARYGRRSLLGSKSRQRRQGGGPTRRRQEDRPGIVGTLRYLGDRLLSIRRQAGALHANPGRRKSKTLLPSGFAKHATNGTSPF